MSVFRNLELNLGFRRLEKACGSLFVRAFSTRCAGCLVTLCMLGRLKLFLLKLGRFRLLNRERLFRVVVVLLGVDFVGAASATWFCAFLFEKDRLGLEKDFLSGEFVGRWAGK